VRLPSPCSPANQLVDREIFVVSTGRCRHETVSDAIVAESLGAIGVKSRLTIAWLSAKPVCRSALPALKCLNIPSISQQYLTTLWPAPETTRLSYTRPRNKSSSTPTHPNLVHPSPTFPYPTPVLLNVSTKHRPSPYYATRSSHLRSRNHSDKDIMAYRPTRLPPGLRIFDLALYRRPRIVWTSLEHARLSFVACAILIARIDHKQCTTTSSLRLALCRPIYSVLCPLT
jgi:hypothetical protein